MKCHICESETDWYCRDCDQPVCEDCAVSMTYHNQIDYTKCQDCHDSDEAQDYLRSVKEWEKEDAEKAKKEARRKARKAVYWKPEAIKKRMVAKELRRVAREALRKKQMAQAIKAVSEMFRGFA